MRILHVMPHYYPAVRYGGPIRSVQGLAAATAALGHDVHVYTTNVDGPGVSDVPLDAVVDRQGVQVRYFPTGLGRKVFRSPAMDRALDETISQFDVVHIHYVWVWPTVAASAAARRQGVPYVLAPRGMLVADLIRRRSPLAKRVWLQVFDKRTVAGAAAIHATARIEADEIKALGLSLPRVAIIPNGIDLPDATAPCPPISRPEADGRPYILFLGRLSWKKGLDRLVAAMRSVPDADLVIAGYDENGYGDEVWKLAAEAGVEHRTRFVGSVEGEEKWALVRAAACLVLPSYNENFGMSALEAMAAGRPVVVSAEVGLADVVAETGCGLVATGGAGELACALNAVLQDAEGADRIGKAGRRAVEERFAWPAIARQMTELYGDCVGDPR